MLTVHIVPNTNIKFARKTGFCQLLVSTYKTNGGFDLADLSKIRPYA